MAAAERAQVPEGREARDVVAFGHRTRLRRPCPKEPDRVAPDTVNPDGLENIKNFKNNIPRPRAIGHESDAVPGDPRRAGADADTRPSPTDATRSAARAAADRAGDAARLRQRLCGAGVAGHVADDLLAKHQPGRVAEVVEVAAALPAGNVAGWIVAALRDGWDVTDRLAALRAARARERRERDAEQRRAQCIEALAAAVQRATGWSVVVSDALDDDRLATAVALATTPVPGLGRRSVPLSQAQLLAWAAAVVAASSQQDPAVALRAAADQSWDPRAAPAEPVELPNPPPAAEPAQAAPLAERLAAVLAAIEPELSRPTSARGAVR